MRVIQALAVIPVIVTLYSCTALPMQRASVPDDAALVARLQRGGHVIFFRHAKTQWNQPDTSTALNDCTTQRNLSDEGRAQARDIGRSFEALGIPIGDVLTSPFCRTYDTGMLAFHRAQRIDDLTAMQSAPPEVRAHRNRALRSLFSNAPNDGTNTVVVAHMYNLKGVVELLIEEGDAAIIEPRGENGFEVIGVVPARKWTELALR